MEIKVGEYVRTDIEGIGKVIEIRDYRVYLDNEKDLHITNVIKHSFNIKKLIEARDIVYFKIKGFNLIDKGIVHETYDARKGKYYKIINSYILEEIEIISILTKEQYERECYRLEDN